MFPIPVSVEYSCKFQKFFQMPVSVSFAVAAGVSLTAMSALISALRFLAAGFAFLVVAAVFFMAALEAVLVLRLAVDVFLAVVSVCFFVLAVVVLRPAEFVFTTGSAAERVFSLSHS